jgi:hypothetical protein
MDGTAAPIGILTRNRALYLDVTLRSLSATALSPQQCLTVFDDASDDPGTRAYLYGNAPIACGSPWPGGNVVWNALGLHVLNERHADPVGIAGRVAVEKLADHPLGVVNASCEMIRRLFARYPDAPGVYLLQDDVIFNEDWQVRMQSLVRHPPGGHGLVGLLSGCRLNRALRPVDRGNSVVYLSSSTTAQCLYLDRGAFERSRAWFETNHSLRSGFDNHLCTAVRNGGYSVFLVNPAVCQHVGLLSLVRPKIRWYARGKRGRICFEARPPYVLANSVKTFGS